MTTTTLTAASRRELRQAVAIKRAVLQRRTAITTAAVVALTRAEKAGSPGQVRVADANLALARAIEAFMRRQVSAAAERLAAAERGLQAPPRCPVCATRLTVADGELCPHCEAAEVTA